MKKPNGKIRKVYNPSQLMRVVQFRILTRILDTLPSQPYVYGFEKGKSIPVMAAIHTGKKVVISLDIKDFFPSIKQYMVENLFRTYGYGETVSRTLSELCTYKSFVPQGSLTAPKISNLISSGTFGPVIDAFCKEHGLTMSIYADDITVSYDKTFDSLEPAKEFSKLVIDTITSAVNAAGFQINREKTKVMLPHNRQWVCGTVVNRLVNMRKTERQQLRAIVYNCTKNGVEMEALKANMSVEAFIRKYAGRINWLYQLNPDKGAILKANFRKASLKYTKKHPDMNIPDLAWDNPFQDVVEVKADEPELPSDFQIPASSVATVKEVQAPPF